MSGDPLFETSSLCGALIDTLRRCAALTASDGAITPDADLAEFATTLKFVKALVTPLLAAGPIVDPAAEICMRGMRDTLDALTKFIGEHVLGPRVRLTVDAWRNKRIYLYQVGACVVGARAAAAAAAAGRSSRRRRVLTPVVTFAARARTRAPVAARTNARVVGRRTTRRRRAAPVFRSSIFSSNSRPTSTRRSLSTRCASSSVSAGGGRR